jgi:hypothetical protein
MTEKLTSAMAAAKKKAQEDGLDYGDRFYLPVKDRLEIFRQNFGEDYGIDTHVFIQDQMVLASAKVIHDGQVLASGNAMLPIENVAAVETAETFAIGRALACFGLAGSEYASANEMERVKSPPKKAPPVDRDHVMAHGSDDGLSQDGRQFKSAVEQAFPKVGGHSFYIPEDGDPRSISKVYEQIDAINDRDNLSAYYGALQHTLQWMHPDDTKEVVATIKARRDQLKG